MLLVPANDLLKQARAFFEGRDSDGNPHEKDEAKAEKLLHEILNHNLGSEVILHMLGSMYLSRGHFGLAIQLLNQVVLLKPSFGEAWNNLGLAYRAANDWNRAAMCIERAMKTLDSPDIPMNLAGMSITRNTPELALRYSEMALAKNPEHVGAKWHKALALLEMRKWDEAWDWHESRLRGGGNEVIANRNYHAEGITPEWDGKSPGRIVIHGEQGMGDEIMFASCIPDAMATEGCEFILEPSPRLEGVFKRSFPGAKVYGTDDTDGRAWVNELGTPDYKIAIGSLPKFYRRDECAFPGTPYLKPDPAKKAWWHDKINALGLRPNIGIAWQGGVPETRCAARSFHPLLLAPLFGFDANWISLQYDPTAADNVAEVKEKLGVKIQHWPRAVAQRHPETGKVNDLDELVALVANLDLVISVCQTAVHVAGALGIPCICLTPSEPSWRYGAGTSEKMPWYGTVHLVRQPKGSTDWTPVIEGVRRHLDEFAGKAAVGC